MPDKSLVSIGNKSFENLKKVNEYGAEYWSARKIQPFLGYTQWRRFEDAIKRAITSCKQSGNEAEHCGTFTARRTYKACRKKDKKCISKTGIGRKKC